MNPFKNYYSQELVIRFFYFCFAFFLCFIVCYWKSNIFLTFFSYPYLKFNGFKRLIALNISELFSLSVYISNTASLFFTYPFFLSQTNYFFGNAWFEEQINDYNKLNKRFCILFLVCFSVCYQILIPTISILLLELDLETHQGLLVLELEPRITNYLEWVFPLLFFLSNLIPGVTLVVFFLLQNLNRKNLLLLLIKKRKLISFIIFMIIFMLVPLDFKPQLLLSSFFILLFESLVFCCCWYS